MVHLFVVGTMLGPGAPGFPWQWDGFGGGPGKSGGSADSTLYPVSDGTPHPKMKVRSHCPRRARERALGAHLCPRARAGCTPLPRPRHGSGARPPLQPPCSSCPSTPARALTRTRLHARARKHVLMLCRHQSIACSTWCLYLSTLCTTLNDQTFSCDETDF